MKSFRFSHCVLSVAGFAPFVFVGVLGCGSGESGPRRSMADVGAQLEAQETAQEQDEQAKAESNVQESQAAAVAVESPVDERQKVGNRPPMEGGYFAAIGGARRHVLNVVDSLSWIQGVRNFKAEKGRKPKDTAEFMKDVVDPYGLQLPALEEGHEYVYDPNGETAGDFGQLYVVDSQTEALPTTP